MFAEGWTPQRTHDDIAVSERCFETLSRRAPFSSCHGHLDDLQFSFRSGGNVV